MISYQCFRPQYQIMEKRSYDILEHCEMTSYQCFRPQHRIRKEALRHFGASCNQSYQMLQASTPDHGKEALRHFEASCNDIISMLHTSIPDHVKTCHPGKHHVITKSIFHTKEAVRLLEKRNRMAKSMFRIIYDERILNKYI
jgi:hypothetical protein